MQGPASSAAGDYPSFSGTDGKTTTNKTPTEVAAAVQALLDVDYFGEDVLKESEILDEDDMATDSATYPPSQQSTAAYVVAGLATKQDTHANITLLTALTDPGADRAMFWDESAGTGGALAWLTPNTGLAIDGTNLNVSISSMDITMTEAYILVGNASSKAVPVAMSGDVTMVASGATSLATDSVAYSETTGSVKALTPVLDAAADFSSTFTGANLYGGTFICDTAGTAALPAVAAGMNFTVVVKGAVATVLNPNATGTEDTIHLVTPSLGYAVQTQGENIDSSADGSMCVLQYYAADTWLAICSDDWTAE